tara:strand:+ start:81 stop:416 length:336 start_codon:yes stop_codon:yes gene_type:complete
MATYVYRNGGSFDKETGQPMLSDAQKAEKPATPQIMGFQSYDCPITGKPIDTLGQHNANLKKHNCVEALEVNPKGATNGEIKNHKFAAKRGLKVSDKYMDQPKLSKGAVNV